jgi:hypothetical protein
MALIGAYGMFLVGPFPYRLRFIFSWSMFIIACSLLFINYNGLPAANKAKLK